MQAWEIREGTLGLHDVDRPRAGSNTAVVDVTHVGICGSDWPKLLAPRQFAVPDPWRPGHEIVGRDSDGRLVTIDPLVPCGTCHQCRSGDTHLCPALQRLGWDLPGGFAEYVAAPWANLHPLPPGMAPDHATLTDPAAVAIHGLRCHPTGPPRRLAIVGAGPISILTALYANDEGWQTTVIHRAGRRPSEKTISSTPAQFSSTTDQLPERTFDVVVDAATGMTPTPLVQALRLVRDGGTVIVQNAYHLGVQLPTPLRDVFRRSIRIIGSYSHCRRLKPTDFTLALDILRRHTHTASALVNNVGHFRNLTSIITQPRRPSARSVLLTELAPLRNK